MSEKKEERNKTPNLSDTQRAVLVKTPAKISKAHRRILKRMWFGDLLTILSSGSYFDNGGFIENRTTEVLKKKGFIELEHPAVTAKRYHITRSGISAIGKDK